MIANKSWADITCILGGVPLLEIQEISCKTSRKYEDHYGAGDKPQTRGAGNVTYDAMTMKMSFDELKRLELAAPNGDITLYPAFTASIVWKPTAQNAVTWTDTLTNVQFTSNGRDLKQGETKHFTTISYIFAGFNDPL